MPLGTRPIGCDVSLRSPRGAGGRNDQHDLPHQRGDEEDATHSHGDGHICLSYCVHRGTNEGGVESDLASDLALYGYTAGRKVDPSR